ncbi:MAG TPA: serine/threonine-protein kinase, partial [Gemmatimonadales bacterium]
AWVTTPDALFLDFQAALAGRYSLERELGRGGMGIVYLARDLRLERVVAIKLLPPERARDDGLRQRFVREARTAAKLSHPHIIPIHAVEETGAFVYFVMAFVDGETLGARVRREGRLKPHEAARVLREVAWALAYAHAQGVVHRDVKPDNILLERGAGRALVLDFGIARLVQAPGVSGAGELAGTPEYMSPEQASGDAVDGRADLYSLGVVAFLALTGRLPFTAPTVPALLVQHVTAPPPRLEAPGAPRVLVGAVERCLAKDPAARFQSGEALADALSGVLAGRPELPLPVRVFLSESRSAMRGWIALGLVGGILVPTVLSAFLNVVFAGQAPGVFRAGVTLVALGFGATALAAPVVFELRRVRRLLRAGYEREDLVRGLRVEAERLGEEREFSRATAPTRSGRAWRVAAYGSLALAAATGVAAWVVPYPAILGVFALFGLSCASAMVTGVAANAASRRRLGIEEERRLKFWVGPLGRWLFKLAGIFGKKPVALPPADRPTEMALGFAALDLFHALPPELRQTLGDVPDVVRGLEDDARRLGRIAENSDPGRDVARQRRGEALAALENLRLDLLRLQAGVGSLDNLTQDLEAAREVGQEVDRL